MKWHSCGYGGPTEEDGERGSRDYEIERHDGLNVRCTQPDVIVREEGYHSQWLDDSCDGQPIEDGVEIASGNQSSTANFS
jgi:hypothetical protein